MLKISIRLPTITIIVLPARRAPSGHHPLKKNQCCSKRHSIHPINKVIQSLDANWPNSVRAVLLRETSLMKETADLQPLSTCLYRSKVPIHCIDGIPSE